MGYRLGKNWSFCVPEEQVVLMDVASNTYVMLPPSLAASFERLCSPEPLDDRDAQPLEKLIRTGIIAQQKTDGVLVPCSLPVEPVRGFEEQDRLGWSTHDMLRAILALGRTRHLLHHHDFAGTLARIRERKHGSGVVMAAGEDHRALQIASTFDRLNALVTRHDQCLLRSLAMIDCLLANGVRANLVFAVATRPFRAHCWVQHGDLVLNDTLEGIGNYTPILVI